MKEQYHIALKALIEGTHTLHVPAQDSDADLVVARYVKSLEDEVARLRQAMLPVVGHIEEDRVILDPRTVSCEEEGALLQAVKAALKGNK